MAMVATIPPPLDFHTNDSSSCSTPYISAPSSPKLSSQELYFSAPTSPTRFSSIYSDFNDYTHENTNHRSSSSSSIIPFDWKQKSVKSHSNDTHELDDDFAFDFSAQLDKSSFSAADELFHGGKIKPLKLPHRLEFNSEEFNDDSSNLNSLILPPSSSISHGKKKITHEDFSIHNEETEHQQERGRREKKKSNHRWTRSLINFEEFHYPDQEKQSNSNPKSSISNSKSKSNSNSNSSRISWPFRKWKLKDFLLFRSKSEGGITENDPLRIYTVLSERHDDGDVKTESFRSTDTNSGTGSKRRNPISPHEVHYTINRAVSEELKKKTFLPYKQGLLGCLGFNPTAKGLSKGLNL